MPAPDLVARDFNPIAPDVTWVGDITYVRTWEGWLFCATVIDLYSRRRDRLGARGASPRVVGR